MKTERTKENDSSHADVLLCIIRVFSLYKLVALFSRVLNNNSRMRTFKCPIHLEIKSLICVAKYNLRPSILKYSHFLLNATERE